MFIKLLFSDPNTYLMWVTLVVFSICCHEYFHARVALWQGDSTAADQGHLTLNPMKQMGLFAIIMLMVIGISWGQVPVNPSRMKHKHSDALVSFAGPFMNLMIFLIFATGSAVVFKFNPHVGYNGTGPESGAMMLLSLGAALNIVLFIFNMLPIPILDGFNVFSFLFPGIHKVNPELKNGITVVLFILVFMYFDIIWKLGFLITNNTVHIIGVVLKILT
ncbi:MAG: site-2 protease family protein [Lentisphaerae bacterium]|nr:site-2 protease family protein [Lentisphaerota bacterium]